MEAIQKDMIIVNGGNLKGYDGC